MDFSLLNLFELSPTIAVLIVVLILYRDMKHIKENLTNHVTDTNKRIDNFDNKFDNLNTKFDTKFETLNTKFDSNFDKLDSKIDNKIDKLDSKFDSKIDKVDSKIDQLLKK